MDATTREVRAALRGLLRRPGFTVISGLTLAVGIAANAAIFTVVDGVLIDPLPFPNADRVVSYNHEAPGLGVNVPVVPHSEGSYLYYRERAREIDAFAVFVQANVNLISEGDPRQLSAVRATEDYFEVLGARPLLGRGFAEGEDRPGAEPVVVLGHALWRQGYGGDPEVVGRQVELDGVQRRVVGVMPEELVLMEEELWIPLEIDDVDPDIGALGLIGVARLREGATTRSADTEMQDLMLAFAEVNADDFPASMLEQARFASDVKPLKDLFVQDMRQALWVLLGTVGFLLLIACANVANLFLVRAEGRQREHAVRSAMGATRGDLTRHYLTESVLLALGSGVVGLTLAGVGVKGLLRLAPAELPQALAIGIDGSVVAFTAALSLAAGVLFGLFPVFGYARRDIAAPLKDGGRGSTAGRERQRARAALVVAQVALALVLLVGSGLMMRSFVALRRVDPGFRTAGLLTFRFALPRAEYADGARVLDFHRQLLDRLASTPGVRSAGMNGGLPLTGSKTAGAMEPADAPFPEGQLGPIVERSQVTPGYFETMSIPIVDGRALGWTDQGDQYRAIVISEALAKAFWPDGSALGRRVRSQGGEDEWEVVGVAGDVRFDAVAEEPLPLAYLPVIVDEAGSAGAAYSMDVVVSVEGDPLAFVERARDVLSLLDPRLPMINPRTVEAIVDESMASTSFTVLLLGIAAAIALLLGTVGLYGVVSYTVSRRAPEIGVRMALGASAETVLRGVVGRGMALAGLGVAIGLIGAWGLSRALASLLFGVTATDPATFLSTAGLLGFVALLATWIPARRAARVDPLEALRTD